MVSPHVETDRPVPAECSMCQVKHDQGRNRNEKPQPTLDRMEGVSRETRHRCRNVGERQNTKAGKGYEEQRRFPETSVTPLNLFAAGTACVFIANEIPTDRQHNKHEP